MDNFKSPKISDETKIIVNDLWEKYTNIVVLGPAGSSPYDIRFRIYAYGGRVAGIPFNKNNDWYLLPNEEYKKYNKAGLENYFNEKSKYINDKSRLNNYIIKILKENTDNIINEVIKAAKEKFSTKEKNPKERSIQTELVRKYLSKYVESGYIICDMEHCVPIEGRTQKKWPTFDLIIMNPKSGKVGLIELKSNRDACYDDNSGLKSHLEDMNTCLSNREYTKYLHDNILYRYACLQNAGLISKGLPKATDIEPIFSAFGGFLFIDDDSKTLSPKKEVVEICEKCFKDDIKYLKDEKNKIRFLYADSANDVDFTQMQSWDDFVK